MLADDLIAAVTIKKARKNAFFPILEDVARYLREAQRYNLVKPVTQAVEQVSWSKPTSILSGIHLVRLPFPVMWIEWEDETRWRERYKHIKRPGREYPDKGTREWRSTPEREGLLYLQHGDDPTRWDAILCRSYKDSREAEVELSALRFSADSFQPSREPTVAEMTEARRLREELKYTGKTSRYIDTYSGDDKQSVAMVRFFDIMKPIANPLMFPKHEEMLSRHFKDLQQSWIESKDHLNATLLFAVGILLMLNSRQAVYVTPTDIPRERQQLRRARGLPPYIEHKTVTIRLSQAMQRFRDKHGTADYDVAAHWVSGHFKIRSTGVFWWSPHIRGNPNKGFIEHEYEVKV